jgi:ATP-dependent helicase/nuclease subunit A
MQEYAYVEGKLINRKRAGSLLDYDDLLIQTRKVLKNNPDLTRFLGRKYKFFLVDEFQDTDRQQWEILSFLSSGNNGLSAGRLFLVGDFGQSIYRFRGAEVRIFSDVGRKIREKGGEDLRLNKNFRSTQALITFVNYIQEKICDELGGGDGDTGRMLLDGNRKTETGIPPVEILVFRGEKGVNREACRNKEAEMLAGKIREVVNVESRDYGDVAVLFRSMSYVRIYEMALRRAGIPYTLLKGGKFFGLPEVRDVINVLKSIEDSGNEIALAGLLRSPVFGVSDDTVYRLCTGSRLWEGLLNWRNKEAVAAGDGDVLDGVIDFLNGAREKKDTIGIYELISWILEQTLFQEVLQGTYAGSRKALNLNKLLQIALSFEAKGLFTLNDFIRYIDNVSVQEYHESEAPIELEEAGVVKVMTVHSAKGLEFPVVFLPDIFWHRKSQSPPLVHNPAYGFAIKVSDEKGVDTRSLKYRATSFVNREEEMAESGRLFYVATTRACDKLILSTGITHSTNRENLFSSWLHWLWDLMPEEISGEEETFCPARDTLGSDYEVTTLTGDVRNDGESYEEDGAAVAKGTERSVAGKEGNPADAKKRISPLEVEEFPHELSVSGILDYMDCPRLFFLRHVLKLSFVSQTKQENPSSPGFVSIGSLAHSALELWDLSTDRELTRVIDALVAGMSDEPAKDAGEKVKTIMEPFCRSELIGEMRSARDKGKLYREMAFTVKIDNVPVRGSIDAVFSNLNGEWVIVDYKAVEAQKESPESTYERYWSQIRMYALAFGILKGEYPKKGKIFFLPAGYAPETEFGGLEDISGPIHYVLDGIREKCYENTDSRCHICEMKKVCQTDFYKGA